MTTCKEVSALLDDYVDGALSPEDLQRVEAHLATCDSCRNDFALLRELLAKARILPRSILPERDLWSGIEARLAPPAGARRGVSGEGIPRPFARWSRVAAAVGFIILGAGLATLWQRRGAPTGFGLEEARYAAASAALAERLAHAPTPLSPATQAVVERNLAIVDAAIHEAEAALAADPGNPSLEQMLIARYEQRLGLLRRAAEAGRRES